METLGKRNNNPMNIRFSKSSHWIGQIGDNKGFCVFTSDNYGLRAGLILIARYIRIYNLNTIDALLSRFAPDSENDLKSYISFCNKEFDKFNLDKNRIIKVNSLAFFVLIRSICIYESRMYYTIEYLSSLVFDFNLHKLDVFS